MKKTLACILMAVAAMSASCNREAPAANAPGRPTVALVLKTLNHPFFVDMRRGAQEAAAAGDARVVDEQADLRVSLPDRGGGSLDRLEIADVAALPLGAQRFGGSAQALLVAADQDTRPAAVGQLPRSRGADPARAAGDDC